MKYSESMIAEMKEIGKFDYNSANAFATKHSLPVRSVIAKARALNIDYAAKDPKQDKQKGPQKADVVQDIESRLAVKLPSLAKMTLPDLLTLNASL